MIIKNGHVLSADFSHFEDRDLMIENGKICDHFPSDATIVDAKGAYIIPGFIDTHIHGYKGVAFCEAKEDFSSAALALARQGTTGIAPAIRCLPQEQLLEAIRSNAQRTKKPGKGAKVYGVHSEAPFISKDKGGAMKAPDITCTVEAVGEMIAAGEGKLKIITIAPERENALDVIAAFKDQVSFSLGHTLATYDEATAALSAGACRSTHTFNAMRSLYHRESGVLGAVLTDDRCTCEMIADFVHLDPPICKMIYKLKGADKITLISDTGEMGGLPDGEYPVDGRIRIVKDGVCKNREGTIAGSCFTMQKGVQNLRKLGIPLPEISRMASSNPAKALGVEEITGSIAPGKCADLIFCDEMANISAVYVDGVLVEEE